MAKAVVRLTGALEIGTANHNRVAAQSMCHITCRRVFASPAQPLGQEPNPNDPRATAQVDKKPESYMVSHTASAITLDGRPQPC